MPGDVLVLRADADPAIGTGHLTRSFALGQAWTDSGGRVVLVTTVERESLLAPMLQEGFEVHHVRQVHPDPEDWRTLRRVLRTHPGEWVGLDGYYFDTGYQERIREAGHPLLVIDDTGHLEEYTADVLLNQNPHASALPYGARANTTHLLGTRFALLRREFKAWRDRAKDAEDEIPKILVTLGGGDVLEHNLRVLEALRTFEKGAIEVTLVVGGATPDSPHVEETARDLPVSVTVIHHTRDMPRLMAGTDVAITGSGSTSWELAFLGVPSLFLVLAENQRPIAEWLDARGVGVNLGSPAQLPPDALRDALSTMLAEPERREEMARLGRDLVDGEGAERVVMTLRKRRIRLRPCRREDRRRLWEWANDPDVRAAAFSSNPIPWEDHIKWFRRTLRDPLTVIFIALDAADEPVGQIRFGKVQEREAEIDVTVARERRGEGYGSLLIREGVRTMARTSKVRTFHAYIKPENERSMKAFEKGRFRRKGKESVRGHDAVHYVRVERGEEDT